jgi:hypothetical protein
MVLVLSLPEEAGEAPCAHRMVVYNSVKGPSAPSVPCPPPREGPWGWIGCATSESTKLLELLNVIFSAQHGDASGEENWLEQEEVRLWPTTGWLPRGNKHQDSR